MIFYWEFEPFAVSQHNRDLLEEITRRRIEKRLREKRQPSPGGGSFLRRMLTRPRRGRNAEARMPKPECFEYPDPVNWRL